MKCLIGTAVCAIFFIEASHATSGLEFVTLDCAFTEGIVTNYEVGKYKDRMLKENFTFTFSGFDEKARTVKVIGNAGSSDAILFVADKIVIVEVTGTGNVMTTSIGPPDSNGKMPAFHSRHVWIAGKPNISHYTRGGCIRRG